MQKILKKKTLAALVVLLAALVLIMSQAGFFSAGASEITEQEYGYYGTGSATITNETINYTSRTVDVNVTTVPVPRYIAYDESICAPIAGAIVTGYYDYFLTNLIPDYTSIVYYNGMYYTNAQTEKVNAVISSLTTSMGTTTANGTTFNGFKNGLTSYAQGKGYSASFTSVMTGPSSSFSLAAYTTQINSGRPVALFLNTYDYVEYGFFSTSGTTDTLRHMLGVSRHVCIGFGYRIFNYYNGSTLFRTDTYLMVSMGNDTAGYLKINDNATIIENAIGVNMY